MLIQFNFQNYKSFRDDTSLDLSATKITEHTNRVVSFGKDKFLRIAAIYGANASGKSNVHDAFKFMSTYVLASYEFSGANTAKLKRRRNHIVVRPFMFDKRSRSEKSVFEVFFIDPADTSNKSYQYGFALKGDKVIEEWLYYKAKTAKEYRTIFYRNSETNELDLDKISKIGSENIRAALGDETLIVSLGELLKIPKLKMVYNWFMENETIDFSNDFESLFRSNMLPSGFVDNINVQNEVVRFFQSFDESIVGFEVKKIEIEDEDEQERYLINAKHKIIGSDETASIPLHEESKGTLEMFSLFPYMQDVLNRGSVLFVDELNTKLHPLLVRNVILTFANPEINTKNAQLIFTTHDSWQLSNNLLRRDEIWFTEKDADGVSVLYSLVDFIDEGGVKIRKDESYEKNYLLGKYGAIPSLKTIDFLGRGSVEQR
jgi:AAA15 family ATPase/GTPase